MQENMTYYGPDKKEYTKTCPLLSTSSTHCECLKDKCMWFKTWNIRRASWDEPDIEPVFVSYCIIYPLVDAIQDIEYNLDHPIN